ncbi:MAG: alpha/beta hydrolase fold domain-containing protein [Caulobacteraceae bacterium]|nr:alpha/beta hydrolase fold domain-containing protein [Caulobacteraceae bacterium]
MNSQLDLQPGADVDPDIRRFVAAMGAGFAAYPPLSSLSFPEQRRVCEQVRAPFTRGGPQPARVFEVTVPAAGREVRLRVYDPVFPRSVASPGLVYLHGGGWTLFSLDTHDRLMREYAARAGVLVIGVDYALSPESKFPVALNEAVAAVWWLRAHAEDVGLDADRLAIGGDSAGANLAISACLALRDAGERDAVKAMVLNYGVFDSDCDTASHRRYGGEGYMLGSGEMAAFWSNYVRGQADLAEPLARPLHADLAALPPALLVIAECDALHDEDQAMARALAAAGVPTTAKVYAGATHSFLEAVSFAAVSGRALDDTAEWLRRTLND